MPETIFEPSLYTKHSAIFERITLHCSMFSRLRCVSTFVFLGYIFPYTIIFVGE